VRNAVVTITIGEDFKRLAALTHPRLKAYAERMGAEFVVIDKPISKISPHFEKYQMFDLLNEYDRIVYLDTDLIVKDDCPSLLEVVPLDCLGAFNEGAFIDQVKAMQSIVKETGEEIRKWDRQYYNTGVMVVSKAHKYLFKRPKKEIFNFYEQSYLNLRMINDGVKMFPLPYEFNRLEALDKFVGRHRLASHIIHYAGFLREAIYGMIKQDLKILEEDPKKRWPVNLLIKVSGGIGDEACAEPVIRYIIEKAYDRPNVSITTWFPRLFKHLPVKVFKNDCFQAESDVPYYVMETLVDPSHRIWGVLSANLVHAIDFVSIVALRRTLPDKDKQVKFMVEEDDVKEANRLLSIQDMGKVALVHPGRGWPTKTFPKEWWEAVLRGLGGAGIRPVLIGKDVSKEQGTVQVDVPEGVIDLRNLLDLGALMAAIQMAPLLISNDSAPIHLAGAFDNGIILIPSCKHPDHVLPYRHGGYQYYKARALYKKLTCEAVDSTPTNAMGQTLDQVVGDIMDYLPDPEEVVWNALDLMGMPRRVP